MNGQRALGQARWQNKEKSLGDEAELFQKSFLPVLCVPFASLSYCLFFHHEPWNAMDLECEGYFGHVFAGACGAGFSAYFSSAGRGCLWFEKKLQEILDS